MIEIKDVELLDLLPYTFKTKKYKALSAAIKAITELFYTRMSSVLFWADIDSASPELLDIMVAELDAPFYSPDMTVEQKRSVIAAAVVFNSKIGTVSSVEGLLSAAFGGGKVREWFSYGGEPYHFKLKVTSELPMPITRTGYELIHSKLDSVKPKRAKLDEILITRNVATNLKVGMDYVKTYKRFVVPAAQLLDEERGYN